MSNYIKVKNYRVLCSCKKEPESSLWTDVAWLTEVIVKWKQQSAKRI